jgi:hypothetical protein
MELQMSDVLQANQQLNVNDQLTPPNGKTHLIMQTDGNLVLYRNDNNQALWASNTGPNPVLPPSLVPNHAIMQTDGNFVCYNRLGNAFWATGSNGHPGSYVALQDDGNLVVYSPNNTPLWASNTVENWDPMTLDTGDTDLGTGEWLHTWASMNASGLIFGHTHTWCTIDLRGFHGSVIPVLLGADGKAVWPPDAQAAKHQYGVDGVWIGQHDRTDYWSHQVGPGVVAQARSLACIQFLDPKNMLMTDLTIVGQFLQDATNAAKILAAL